MTAFWDHAHLKMVMTQYKSGKRYSTVMGRLLKGYTEEEINGLAQYFSKQPWTPVAQQTDAAAAKKVKDVFERCETCHGNTGGKPDDDSTPKLNGQWQRYLQLELEKYVSVLRTPSRWPVVLSQQKSYWLPT